MTTHHPLHNHRYRRWLYLLAGLVIIGLFAYGSYRYIQLRKKSDAQQVVIEDLRATLTELEGNLSLTEYERDKLTHVLQETEQKAGLLEEETEVLEEKVGLFEKLTTIDPELLKKYSKVYFLNEHYAPPKLADVDPIYVNGDNRTMQVNEQMWPYLKALLDDSTNEGLSLLVTSAYRSFGTQAALKASYRVIYGAGTANQFSADQGYSEHQLGTTVDLTTKKMRDLGATFDKTPEFKWLTEHAHEYGFVLSYPKGNKYYIYEPWHWRFVGKKLASFLREENKTLYTLDQREIDKYLVTIFD